MLSSMSSRGSSAWDANPGFVVMFGAIAISIILPVATIILVQRKIAPAARARFREKPATT
jgi:hypothetical protein